MKGIKQAAFVNVVTTIAKLVPIFFFILVASSPSTGTSSL